MTDTALSTERPASSPEQEAEAGMPATEAPATDAPATEVTTGSASAPGAEAPTLAPGATNISVSRGFNNWLRTHRLSLAFTSYQTGQLFLVGSHANGTVSFNQQNFSRAMGVCWRPGRLYLGSLSQVWRLENMLRPGEVGNKAGSNRLSIFPVCVISQHCVESDEEFSHGGDDGDFGWFSSAFHSLVECCDDWVCAAGDESGHVEGIAQGFSSADDASLSLEGAAFAIERSDADESGGLSAGHGSQLGHEGDEGGGGDGADAGGRAQPLMLVGEVAAPGEDAGDFGFEEEDFGGETLDALPGEALDQGMVGLLGLVGAAGAFLAQLAAGGDEPGERCQQGIVACLALWQGRTEACDHGRVDAVVLGQDTGGAGELTQASRIDPARGQPGRTQRREQRAFISSRCLEADGLRAQPVQPAEQIAQPLGVVGESAGLTIGPQAGIELRLADIDADKSVMLCHIFVPFLACAGSGPVQPFGLMKIRSGPSSPADCNDQGGRGLGKTVREAPRAVPLASALCLNLKIQGGPDESRLKPSGRMAIRPDGCSVDARVPLGLVDRREFGIGLLLPCDRTVGWLPIAQTRQVQGDAKQSRSR
nr:DUF4915 domain-containing protein [Novosphingobium kaempferiae]